MGVRGFSGPRGSEQSLDAGDQGASKVDVDRADDEFTQCNGSEEGEYANAEGAGDVANGVGGDGGKKRPEEDEETATWVIQLFANMSEFLWLEMLIDLPNRREKVDQSARENDAEYRADKNPLRVPWKEQRASKDKGGAWKQCETAEAGNAKIGRPDPVRISRQHMGQVLGSKPLRAHQKSAESEQDDARPNDANKVLEVHLTGLDLVGMKRAMSMLRKRRFATNLQ